MTESTSDFANCPYCEAEFLAWLGEEFEEGFCRICGEAFATRAGRALANRLGRTDDFDRLTHQLSEYNTMLIAQLPDARRRADETTVARICAAVAYAVTEEPPFRYDALWRIDDQDAMIRICLPAGNTFASRGSFGTAASWYKRGLNAARAIDDRDAVAQAASALAALAPGIERESGAFTHELLRLHNARTAYRDAAEAYDLLGRGQAAFRLREHAQWCDEQLDDRRGGRPFTDADAGNLLERLIHAGVPCPYSLGLAVPADPHITDKLPKTLLAALKVSLAAQLGEAVERASLRIQPISRPWSLKITVPGTPVPTLLILPQAPGAPPTHEATAAMADVDLTGEESRGHQLSWDQTVRAWLIHERPAPRLR